MPLCYQCFHEKDAEGPCPFCGYDDSGARKKHPQALREGAILNGRYIVGRVLGQGGFGITYLALDDKTGCRVAIKEYYPAEFAGRAADGLSVSVHSEEREENFAFGKAQFLEEARTLANFIGNEHVVRIRSYFEENDTAYFVMDFIEGPSLDRYMAQFGGRLGVREAKHLLLPLMDALEDVHRRGIVHRDIAPDNILISGDGTARLIDFGAARYSTGEKTKSLDVVLKHGFAPYEQYMRRGRQGPWTDVYAMGATFYYAITGKVPPEAVERKDEDTLIPPSTLGVRVDDETEDALLKALEVSSGDRFQSMRDFCAAMGGSAASQPTPKPKPKPEPESVPKSEPTPASQPKPEPAPTTQPEPKTGPTQPILPKQRLPLIFAAAAVLVLVLVFAITGNGKKDSPAVSTAPTAPPTAAPSSAAIAETPAPADDTPSDDAPAVDPLAARYGEAERLLADGHWGLAYGIFSELGDYEDAASRAEKIERDARTSLSRTMSAGSALSVFVHPDGTVSAIGSNANGACDVSGWRDVVSVSCHTATVGLRADGTVLAVGSNSSGKCDVDGWDHVVAIATGFNSTVGLRADGTVLYAGVKGDRDVSGWTDIVAIAEGSSHILGLRADGTVLSTGSDRDLLPSGWSNMADISAGMSSSLGLRDNGTVVSVWKGTSNVSKVTEWRDIVQISAGSFHAVGLQRDGTVVAVGNANQGQCDVSGWTDIVAVAAGEYHTLGLKSDGSIVAVGYNDKGQCDVRGLKKVSVGTPAV